MVRGLDHMTPKEKLRERGEGKAKGVLLTVFIFLMGGCREYRGFLFLEVHSKKDKGQQSQFATREFLTRYKDCFVFF